MRKLIVFFLSLLIYSVVSGQTDNVLWAGAGVQVKWNNRISTILKPIVRVNEDISNYLNTSVDASIKYKFDSHWALEALARTWFVPDASNRQFLWLRLTRYDRIESLKISVQNKLMYHGGLDINERDEPDFFRWRLLVQPSQRQTLTPFVATEAFWRFNSINALRQMRYEIGVNWRIATNLSFAVMYRRQNSVSSEPIRRDNHWVTSLLYTLQ